MTSEPAATSTAITPNGNAVYYSSMAVVSTLILPFCLNGKEGKFSSYLFPANLWGRRRDYEDRTDMSCDVLLSDNSYLVSSFSLVACKGAWAILLNLINCVMDPFDDILPVAPAARKRPGTKFMPKAKSKQPPRKGISASEHATSSKDGISGNECQNAVASTLSMPVEESLGSNHCPQAEIPKSADATNNETGNAQEVSVVVDTAAIVDGHLPSTMAVSEVDAKNQNFTNFSKSPCEADPVHFEVDSVTNFTSKTNFDSGVTQPVHPDTVVENELNNVADPSITCSTVNKMQKLPKYGEGSFLERNECLELTDNSLQVGTLTDLKNASDYEIAIFESNIHSKSNFEREQKVMSAEFELEPLSNALPDPGTRNAHKFQPKIKPRPRVGNTPVLASTSSNVMTEKSVELPTSCTNEFQALQSSGDSGGALNESTSIPIPTVASEILRTTEDNRSLAAEIPSQLDSLNAMLPDVAINNGARDWPSSFAKSSGEAADIFSELESLDDFITQAATDTGKPAMHSLIEKGAEESCVTPTCNSMNSFGVCDTTQVQRHPEHHTTQDSSTFNEASVLNGDDSHINSRRFEAEEAMDLNPACPGDNVFDDQSMKSGTDPTSEIPVHEESSNAANSPTLADFLHSDGIREKEDANERKKDSSTSSSLRKRRRSSVTHEEDKGGMAPRQLTKQVAHKPANSLLNEDVDNDDNPDPPYNPNGDDLEENDVNYEIDHSSKKKRVSASSKKKPVAKNGKTSQKRKKANDALETPSEEPPKKFSHSSRRRKRCVDKALLEIPEDELDPRTLRIKDIILLAEYRERQAKKDGTTLETSSTYQSGVDFMQEANANNEDEIFGSEDGRDPDDYQANESIPSAPSLFNYQSFMEKTPRGKWSKQDTELFYEAVRQFGTDFSLIQQLFPDKTRHQIKLKYKKEERQHPLRLSDAVNNRSKDLSHFKLVIERLQQASTQAKEDISKDASDMMAEEEVVDLTPEPETNNDANVKAQEDSVAGQSPEQSDDGEDDYQLWSQYTSTL
ncbi:hypothetical protein RJT34_05197 [Clitoria ternatea]|uniref:SANT domain-containing protein n=1 Tax=Clitoria ternatea TaxID=43366 RepID=A0AAN9PSU9_CLITE